MTALIFTSKGGPNNKIPTTTAESAAISTLAAPTSFPTLARGCKFGLAKSTTISNAVFKNSAVQTIAMVRTRTAQSRNVI